MFERMGGSSGRNIGFRISGMLTGEEAKAILVPELHRAIEAYSYVHLLLHLDGFKGMTSGAIIEELKNSPEIQQIKRIAIVGDPGAGELAAVQLFGAFLLPTGTRIQHFRSDAIQQAWDWLYEEE